MRRSLLFIFIAILGTAGIGFRTASASSSGTYANSILCGLWAGVNLDISLGCPDNADSDTDSEAANNNSVTGNYKSGRYVALGDSVAAGLGLPQKTESRDSFDETCGRSSQAYPNIVASQTGMQVSSYACSGATAGDLVTKQSVSGPNVNAQLDNAFSGGTPSLITITAGANDVHWRDFIYACYNSDCTGSFYNYAARAATLLLHGKLNYALTEIERRSGDAPKPKVIITGYYNPLGNECQNQYSAVTNAELQWLNSQFDSLNETIKSVSGSFDFVTYVPLSFSGHGICSASPWVQALDDNAPLHPNAVGQQVIADAILSFL